MADSNIALIEVDALPEPKRGGNLTVRTSPYTPVLEQIRDLGVNGKAYQITVNPIDEPGAKSSKSAAVATRIKNGRIAGIPGGEFEARSENGLVFVQYLGPDGIAKFEADAPAREAAKAARAAKRNASANGNGAAPAGVQVAQPSSEVAFAEAADDDGWN